MRSIIYICTSKAQTLFFLWPLSWPGSLASRFTRNGPKPSCSEADDYNIWSSKWRRDRFQCKQTDLLQLNAILICEFPENFLRTLLSSLHWKRLLCVENKPQTWQSFSVFCPSSSQANASSIKKLPVPTHLTLHRACTRVSNSISEFCWPTTRQKL